MYVYEYYSVMVIIKIRILCGHWVVMCMQSVDLPSLPVTAVCNKCLVLCWSVVGSAIKLIIVEFLRYLYAGSYFSGKHGVYSGNLGLSKPEVINNYSKVRNNSVILQS